MKDLRIKKIDHLLEMVHYMEIIKQQLEDYVGSDASANSLKLLLDTYQKSFFANAQVLIKEEVHEQD